MAEYRGQLAPDDSVKHAARASADEAPLDKPVRPHPKRGGGGRGLSREEELASARAEYFKERKQLEERGKQRLASAK